MAYYATMTQVGCVSGVEQRKLGTDAWIRVDGRLSESNMLDVARDAFRNRGAYRVIVCAGELRAGSTLRPLVWTDYHNDNPTFDQIKGLIN